MLKRTLGEMILVITLLTGLSACSASVDGITPSNATQQAQGTPQPGFNLETGELPLETRLSMGILALENSDLAVTPQQAQTLLPLWKAVKSLSNSETASSEEIQALYEQIQENLTTEQNQHIQNLDLTQDDLRALMEQYGIQPNLPADMEDNLSQEQIATRVAQRAEGGFPGGGPGGGFPPDGGMGGGGGMPPSFSGQNGQQVTPDPTRIAQRRGLGIIRLFLDPVIQLLESRAAEG